MSQLTKVLTVVLGLVLATACEDVECEAPCAADDPPGADCAAFEPVVPSRSVRFVVRNAYEEPIALASGSCEASDRAVRVDDQAVFVSFFRSHCSNIVECVLTGCEGAPQVTIPSGDSEERVWDTLAFGPLETVPDACRESCNVDLTKECRPLIAAGDGAHVVTVTYVDPQMVERELSVDFELPASSDVEVVLAPPE